MTVLQANGFRILWHGYPHSGPDFKKTEIELLEDINDIYAPLQHVISFLGYFGLISPRLVALFETLRTNWEVTQCDFSQTIANHERAKEFLQGCASSFPGGIKIPVQEPFSSKSSSSSLNGT